jgi:hypothetical protein
MVWAPCGTAATPEPVQALDGRWMIVELWWNYNWLGKNGHDL